MPRFDESAIGLLSAVTPAATLVAVAAVRTSGDDRSLLRRGLAIAGLAAAGASLLAFAGVGGIGAFVTFFLVGVIFGFVTWTNVVVGRRIPEDNRVGIFSILQSGVFLGLSLGALGGGVVSELTTPEIAAGGAMALGAVCLLGAVPYVGRLASDDPVEHAA